ncbi:hypothetical protein PHLCEN_2v8422 [Hermanssonia centrifuga]|uniref:Uncharacterized protein n=1 Tax=Hermanssonia centrifuga TaxID=98765 RepID=A0A2R6NUF0_9APHY|nr:hypothetical protein PHLCEN_2v8422 [Hermanssonia centrifuga]
MTSTKLLALTCVAVLAASSFAVHESFPTALGTAFRPISVERDSGSDSEDEESQVEGMLLDEAREVEAMLLDEIDDEPRFPPLHVRIEVRIKFGRSHPY